MLGVMHTRQRSEKPQNPPSPLKIRRGLLRYRLPLYYQAISETTLGHGDGGCSATTTTIDSIPEEMAESGVSDEAAMQDLSEFHTIETLRNPENGLEILRNAALLDSYWDDLEPLSMPLPHLHHTQENYSYDMNMWQSHDFLPEKQALPVQVKPTSRKSTYKQVLML